MQMLISLGICLFLACAYRFRGGGFIATGHTTLCRLVWATCMEIAYALHAGANTSLIVAITVYIFSFLSLITVDHSMAQNMGMWPKLQCRWYTKFLVYLPLFPSSWRTLSAPDDNGIRTADWGTATVFQKTLFDFMQMIVVGLARGLLVFVPYTIANAFDGATFHSLLVVPVLGVFGSLIMAGLTPVSYLVARWVPFTIPTVATAKTEEWGEVFNGFAWGVALAALYL